jgi:nitrous oxidase accessory protein
MRLQRCAYLVFVALLALPYRADAATCRVGANAAADPLRTAIAAAADGDTLLLAARTYEGPVTIDRSLTVVSDGGAIIDGQGHGTVLEITAPNVTLRGLTIRNSGTSLTREDAGVSASASGLRIENCRIENVLFGVYLRQAPHATLLGNEIVGYESLDVPRRGDLVRAWYSRCLHMESNTLESGRDVIVWFSDSSTVANNKVSGARYGVHFMYDNDCVATGNTLTHNSVGAYLMYSRRLTVINNTVAYNRGATGLGIGLKDVDNSTVEGNLVVDNRAGIFVDNSPRDIDGRICYQRNVAAYNDAGIRFSGVVERTRIADNSFLDNYEDVLTGGREELRGVKWQGNYWSALGGFDIDGNGTSDVPYRAERLFEDLIAHHPRLRLFVYSPAIQALNLAARAFPVVRPQAKFTDNTPRMRPLFPADAPRLSRTPAWRLATASMALAVLGLFAALMGRLNAPGGRGRAQMVSSNPTHEERAL